jgi:tetratricopeptide (TPR) repeat protein
MYFRNKIRTVDDKKGALIMAAKCFGKAHAGGYADASQALHETNIDVMEIKLRETRRIVQRGGRAQARERKAAVEKQQTTLIEIAVECLHAGFGKKAAVHLYNAKLFAHAAAVFKVTSSWENAARCYERLEDTDSAVGCLTRLGRPKAIDRAIQLLKQTRKYDQALELAMDHNLFEIREELARMSAKWYFRQGDAGAMQAALGHLPVAQQKQFLLETEQLDKAVALMTEQGEHLEAAQLLLQSGNPEVAAEYIMSNPSQNQDQSSLLAGRCFLVAAERALGSKDSDVEQLGRKALGVFTKLGSKEGEADAREFLGRFYVSTEDKPETQDSKARRQNPSGMKLLREAIQLFHELDQPFGVEQCFRLVHEQNPEQPWDGDDINEIKWSVEELQKLAVALCGECRVFPKQIQSYFGIIEHFDPTLVKLEKHANIRLIRLLQAAGGSKLLLQDSADPLHSTLPKRKVHCHLFCINKAAVIMFYSLGPRFDLQGRDSALRAFAQHAHVYGINACADTASQKCMG